MEHCKIKILREVSDLYYQKVRVTVVHHKPKKKMKGYMVNSLPASHGQLN